MAKKINFQMGLTLLLGLSLAGIALKSFLFKSHQGGGLQPKQMILSKEENHLENLSISPLEETKLEWGLDPFRVAASSDVRVEKTELGVLALTGISWSEDRPVAILNDTIIHTGDTFNGYQVVEIRKDRVLMKKGEEVIELYQKGEKP